MQPTFVALLLLGLIVGAFSGLVGVGGGIILVPALVFIFGLPQHTAQGTTLALLVPPIGIFAAYDYYKKGHVDVRIAAIICLGFVFGGIFGAKAAGLLSAATMRRVFGGIMLAVSLKMLLA
jgi:uncharacterized membrane protein YfcA